jgi:hypothetical protein
VNLHAITVPAATYGKKPLTILCLSVTVLLAVVNIICVVACLLLTSFRKAIGSAKTAVRLAALKL